MFAKGERTYADWYDKAGKRKRETFTTAEAARGEFASARPFLDRRASQSGNHAIVLSPGSGGKMRMRTKKWRPRISWLVLLLTAASAVASARQSTESKPQPVSQTEMPKPNADGCMFNEKRIDGICQSEADDTDETCAAKHLQRSVLVAGYNFRNYRSDEGACLRVLRGGKEIFRRTISVPNTYNNGYTLGQPAKTYKWGPKPADRTVIPMLPNGADVTGLGYPDMIVQMYSGGAHCCTFHYVFGLEPKFRMVALLDAADTDFPYFADLDHDGHYYYLAEDWTFAYWPGSFAGSPNAPVVLRYREDAKGGGFHLALDKMRKPAPSPQEWKKTMREIDSRIVEQNRGYMSFLSSGLWDEVMRLLYFGQEDLAWKLADDTAKRAKLDENMDDFCSQLKTSPYWPDLEPSLKHIPPACAQAKPSREEP